MADRDDILAQYAGPSLTTADVIRAMPYEGDPLDLKAQMRDRAMRGQKMSPEMTARIAPDPKREANLPWLRRALDAANEFSPAAMFAANFVGPRARMPARLDMSQAAKNVRAAEQGYGDTFYHGTTHKFREFDDPATSPRFEAEGHHGPAAYMTSSRYDTERNYKGPMGPDLKNRIERVGEKVFVNDDEMAALKASRSPEEWLALAKVVNDRFHGSPYFQQRYANRRLADEDIAWLHGYDQLVGDVPDGRVLNLRHRAQNPVVIEGEAPARFGAQRVQHLGPRKETIFEYENPFWVDSSPDGQFHVMEGSKRLRSHPTEDLAYGAADELNNLYAAKGQGPKLIDEVRRLPGGSDLADELYTLMMDNGGVRASEFERMFRSSDIPMMAADEGIPAGIHKVYQGLGHDAAILKNADRVFPGMGMEPGTTHAAVYDPRLIRRTNAAFDPAKKNSANLLAGLGTGAITTAEILRSFYGDEQP